MNVLLRTGFLHKFSTTCQCFRVLRNSLRWRDWSHLNVRLGTKILRRFSSTCQFHRVLKCWLDFVTLECASENRCGPQILFDVPVLQILEQFSEEIFQQDHDVFVPQDAANTPAPLILQDSDDVVAVPTSQCIVDVPEPQDFQDVHFGSSYGLTRKCCPFVVFLVSKNGWWRGDSTGTYSRYVGTTAIWDRGPPLRRFASGCSSQVAEPHQPTEKAVMSFGHYFQLVATRHLREVRHAHRWDLEICVTSACDWVHCASTSNDLWSAQPAVTSCLTPGQQSLLTTTLTWPVWCTRNFPALQ